MNVWNSSSIIDEYNKYNKYIITYKKDTRERRRKRHIKKKRQLDALISMKRKETPYQIGYKCRVESHPNDNFRYIRDLQLLNIEEGYYHEPLVRSIFNSKRGNYQTFSIWKKSKRMASFCYIQRFMKVFPYKVISETFKAMIGHFDFQCEYDNYIIESFGMDLNKWIDEYQIPIEKFCEYLIHGHSNEFSFIKSKVMIPLEYNIYKNSDKERVLEEFQQLCSSFITDTEEFDDIVKLVHSYEMLRFQYMMPLYEYPYGTEQFSCMILHNLITDKSFRNKGFASELIISAIRHASDSDVEYLVLYVSINDNKDRLIRFFEKFGFLIQPNDSHLVKSLQFDRKSNSEETEICMSIYMK
jgi:GNAT superfamily N-acetyltransferase